MIHVRVVTVVSFEGSIMNIRVNRHGSSSTKT